MVGGGGWVEQPIADPTQGLVFIFDVLLLTFDLDPELDNKILISLKYFHAIAINGNV